MPSVSARFRVGFVSNTEYAMLTNANKAVFKDKVEEEIKSRVRDTDLASWNGLVITVDANFIAGDPRFSGEQMPPESAPTLPPRPAAD